MSEEMKLFSSLCIPSSANSYGIAIEYMRKWFLSQFDSEYWKHVHIDGKFVLDDFRRFNHHESVKIMKPMVSIVPEVIFDHDREKLDLYQGSLHQLIRRSRANDSFFVDISKNIAVSLMMEQLQMNFTFRMKTSSKAQQMELYKYIQMAFRIGSTQGETLDIDFHIPNSLILQLANDAGFKIIGEDKNKKVENVISFVKYLNQHSVIPILYKYRNMNGKDEFFLRMSNMYCHLSCTDYPSADNGEREGMIYNNFMIDMNVVLQMPIPKAYSYHSMLRPDIIKHIDSEVSPTIGVTGIEIIETPDKNSKGWERIITTDYYHDDLTAPLTINFSELFEDSDVLQIIKYNNSIAISSNVFIDFLLYNNNKKIDYTIDWTTLTLTTNVLPERDISSIVIYADLEYINNTITILANLEESRLR